MANIADFVTQNFRGPNLAQIDRARTVNALGQLDLQNEQMRQQTLLNPNATPDQMARFAPQTAQVIQQQQIVGEHQKATASAVLAQRYSAVARSAKPLAAYASLVQSPEFGQMAKVAGFDPAQFTVTPQDTDESIREGAIDHARALGVDPMAKDIQQQQLTETIRHNQATEATAAKVADNRANADLMTPEGIDLASQEYLNTGKLPPRGGAAQNARVINRSAEIARLNGDDAKAATLARAGFLASKTALARLTTQRTMVGAFERTALKNLEIAVDESQKVDRTGVPAVNRWLLAGKKSLAGDVEVGRFNAALTSALNEYAKVLSGATSSAGISDAARREAEQLISTANTPEQVIGIADIMKREMANREAGFAEQEAQLHESMTGRPAVNVAPASPGAPVAPGSAIGAQNSVTDVTKMTDDQLRALINGR